MSEAEFYAFAEIALQPKNGSRKKVYIQAGPQ